MNLTLTIDLESAGLRDLELMLGPSKRVELHQAMGEGVRLKTFEHLAELSLTKHTTANRLGATPTKHLADAAKAVEKSPVEADGSGGTLTINWPGLGRALHDVTIVPQTTEFIPIALNALAYGRSPREFGRVAFVGGRGKPAAGSDKPKRKPQERKPIPMDIPAYLLVRSVTQHQDRSLLPSEDEWAAAATEAAELWFQSQATSLS
jgi:hypothetical protein